MQLASRFMAGREQFVSVIRAARLTAWAPLFWVMTIGGIAPARAVTIDWVAVGDPGNQGDTFLESGVFWTFGAVADPYRIMKFEWTNSQYVEFLNAVDPAGTNPNSIYNPLMADGRGGITFTTANGSGSKYAVRTNMGDKPVNFVSWFDAARVANWLHNGGGSGSTETGAYTLDNATSGNAPAANPGARFSIPTDDQWYKAAYYKGSGTNAGYWSFATQSNTDPAGVPAGPTGIGLAGNTGNSVNYGQGASWNGMFGNVTTVGTNGGPSAYGTFDMNGNVSEWNDLDGTTGSVRRSRGGGWLYSGAQYFSSFNRGNMYLPSQEDFLIGFRLASPASGPSGVPEIDLSGLRLAAAILVGGLALREGRRFSR